MEIESFADAIFKEINVPIFDLIWANRESIGSRKNNGAEPERGSKICSGRSD
jgi:hypothetical protein